MSMSAEVQRDAPPILERINDPQELLAQILECLQFQDSRGLKTYILEHKLKHDSILWELVLKIGEQVTVKTSEDNGEFFDACTRCLLYLVKVGKPKEMLLALLEQMDTFIDDTKYSCFLPMVQLVLLRIPSKLFHSLDIAMETVSAHLTSLPVPQNVTLEGEERRLFHIDKAVVRIVDILQSFLDFIEPFIKFVTDDQNILSENKKSEALVLKKHLLHVFDFPLLHLVLTQDASKPQTHGRRCVERAMAMLSVLETDFHRLLTNCKTNKMDSEVRKVVEEDSKEEDSKDNQRGKEEDDNEENERRLKEKEERKKQKDRENDFVECWDFKLEVREGGQACLGYILHAEFLGLDKYPQVFARAFLLEYHLEHASFLLKSTVFPINEKGLLLCQSLVEPVLPGSLPAPCLDNPVFMATLNDLIHVMVKCPVRDHRTLALPVFTSLIGRFEEAGRYLIYKNLLSSCSHSGVKGYVITLVKDDISQTLKSLNSDSEKTKVTQEKRKYFTGSKLSRILSFASALPEKETSDMLENSDQIISVLNLLRFIVLADPVSKNVSGFWNYLPSMEKEFLEPVRKGLDLSEAHYNLERQNVREGKDPSPGPSSTEMDVSVAGASLPVMEKQEKLQLIAKAVNSHQLMKSLLSRLSELVDRARSDNV